MRRIKNLAVILIFCYVLFSTGVYGAQSAQEQKQAADTAEAMNRFMKKQG